MNHQDLKFDLWDNLLNIKKIRDENKFTPKLEASTDDFTTLNVNLKNVLFINYKHSADEQ